MFYNTGIYSKILEVKSHQGHSWSSRASKSTKKEYEISQKLSDAKSRKIT